METLDRRELEETMKIIIRKNKEYIRQLRKAKIAINNFCEIMGKYAIENLRVKE